MKRRTMNGSFHVGGDDRRLPTLYAAVSLAQSLACRATEPRQWGVFDNGTQLYRVERQEDGVVTTVQVM